MIGEMKALIIGGTGLISTGIVKHLLARGADVTMFNRGKRENRLPGNVKQIVGDRDAEGTLAGVARAQPYDVVIDMIGFSPKHAEADVTAFSSRCGHFIFCSTVCTYGVKLPPGVLIDESFPQEPISDYGRNKVACEEIILRADEAGKLAQRSSGQAPPTAPADTSSTIWSSIPQPGIASSADCRCFAAATGWGSGSRPTVMTAASSSLTRR